MLTTNEQRFLDRCTSEWKSAKDICKELGIPENENEHLVISLENLGEIESIDRSEYLHGGGNPVYFVRKKSDDAINTNVHLTQINISGDGDNAISTGSGSAKVEKSESVIDKIWKWTKNLFLMSVGIVVYFSFHHLP